MEAIASGAHLPASPSDPPPSSQPARLSAAAVRTLGRRINCRSGIKEGVIVSRDQLAGPRRLNQGLQDFECLPRGRVGVVLEGVELDGEPPIVTSLANGRDDQVEVDS